jgi:hypothetical protein
MTKNHFVIQSASEGSTRQRFLAGPHDKKQGDGKRGMTKKATPEELEWLIIIFCYR